ERRSASRRPVRFGLTTNGSLLDDRVVSFLEEHRFRIQVSFDGLAQDLSRRKGSRRVLTERIARLLRSPALQVETNSVFTPRTVTFLSGSLKLLHDLGVPEIHLSLSSLDPWPRAALAELRRQLRAYGRYARSRPGPGGRPPLDLFRPANGNAVFICVAGSDRVAVAPDGTVWGCHLFIDHFWGRRRSTEARRYNLGRIDRFQNPSPSRLAEIRAPYAGLSAFRFRTPDGPCWACPDVGDCAICPLDASPPGGEIGLIPAWTCRTEKILREARDWFQTIRAF
ncbi:MAG: hypothetical protein JW742_05370, partial [Candidatus Aminicenantes bacterium]|nr:hypothetical protein [Candidatus Aminicenantes bacterium]